MIKYRLLQSIAVFMVVTLLCFAAGTTWRRLFEHSSRYHMRKLNVLADNLTRIVVATEQEAQKLNGDIRKLLEILKLRTWKLRIKINGTTDTE